jgi:hypothetical protein
MPHNLDQHTTLLLPLFPPHTEIENLTMGHPAVAEAAVVAIPDARWGERPLLVVVLKAVRHWYPHVPAGE